jgi:ABC-type nitrate/sulfonate/bicarbonate transport system permease component
MMLLNFLIPKAKVNKSYLVVGWTLTGLVLWQVLKPAVFPNPLEVVQAVPTLISDGLIDDLMVSIWTNAEALFLSLLVGLPFSYLSRVPILSPVVQFVSKLRFLSSGVFFLPFVFLLGGGHSIKV